MVLASAGGSWSWCPFSFHSPSALASVSESMGANPWPLTRSPIHPSLTLPPSHADWGVVWGGGGWDRPDLAGGDHLSEHSKPQ